MSHAVLHLLIIETSRNYQITDVNRGICDGVEEGVGEGVGEGVEGGERGEEDVEAQNKCSYQFHYVYLAL